MIYIVMGVSGCGKTTIGKQFAERLKIDFFDADDFHPAQNIKKMSQGIALTDQDRYPWLQAMREQFPKWNKKGAVLACSALKEVYRTFLKEDFPLVKYIYLNGDYQLIYKRLSIRKNHFMQTGLLRSQFEALEIPKYGIHVNIDQSVEEIIEEILKKTDHE